MRSRKKKKLSLETELKNNEWGRNYVRGRTRSNREKIFLGSDLPCLIFVVLFFFFFFFDVGGPVE